MKAAILGVLALASIIPLSTARADAPNIRDASYQIEGRIVTLSNGISEVEAAPGSASKVTTQFFGNEASGDLNGDGIADVGFVLTQSTGGSGTFYYVVVALKTADGYVGTNAVLLGDRIAPQTTRILSDGTLVVNYAVRKPGDAMTVAPSVGVSKYLGVTAGKLVEVAPPVAMPVAVPAPAQTGNAGPSLERANISPLGIGLMLAIGMIAAGRVATASRKPRA